MAAQCRAIPVTRRIGMCGSHKVLVGKVPEDDDVRILLECGHQTETTIRHPRAVDHKGEGIFRTRCTRFIQQLPLNKALAFSRNSLQGNIRSHIVSPAPAYAPLAKCNNLNLHLPHPQAVVITRLKRRPPNALEFLRIAANGCGVTWEWPNWDRIRVQRVPLKGDRLQQFAEAERIITNQPQPAREGNRR